MGGHPTGRLLDTIAVADHVRLDGGIDMQAIRQQPRAVRGASEEHDMDPIAHRELVVHRLLDRGMHPDTLTTLFPDWRELIIEIAASVDGG